MNCCFSSELPSKDVRGEVGAAEKKKTKSRNCQTKDKVGVSLESVSTEYILCERVITV